MKTEITFAAAVNWEYVSAHHKRERDGKVKPGPWCHRIIEHARRNGYLGKITAGGACRIINAHTASEKTNRGRGQVPKEKRPDDEYLLTGNRGGCRLHPSKGITPAKNEKTRDRNMNIETKIQTAIARSISHTEIVHVDVDDLEESYLAVSVEAHDCDRATEDDGSLDVWGTTEDSSSFRLRLRKA